MSRQTAEELAEIERQKEQHRNDLRNQISALNQKIARLNVYKERLSGKREATNSSVYAPVVAYDLTATSDIAHWAGHLEEKGEGYRDDVAKGVHVFLDDISKVISDIDEVIRDIRTEIGSLQAELDSI